MYRDYCELLVNCNRQIQDVCPKLHDGLEKSKGPAFAQNLLSENMLTLLLSQKYFSGLNSDPLCTGPGISGSSAFPSSTSSKFGCLLDLAHYKDSILIKVYLEPRLTTALWSGLRSSVESFLDRSISESITFRTWLPIFLIIQSISWIVIFYMRYKRCKKAVMLATFVPIESILANPELKLLVA